MKDIQSLLLLEANLYGFNNPFTFMLMDAAENGFTTEAEDLIKKGAEVNGNGAGSGKRPLDIASENGKTEIVRLLINNGANIEDKESTYFPLELAVSNGHTETAALLIDVGVNINQAESYRMSALQLASQNGHNNTVKMLIQRGANVHYNPGNGFQPALMLAAIEGHTDVAETLIEGGGANLNYKDNQDLSVLEKALMNSKTGVAKLLIEKGAKIDGALVQAFKNNFTELVDILLSKEIADKQKDKYGTTMLMIAATCGKTELMTNLIDKESDIDEKDNEGMTALMHAANKGFLKAVEILIEGKAHVNQKSKNGMTPLMFACAPFLQSEDVVEKLIEHGACINERNKDGKTALMYASMRGCTGIVERLIEHGAYINEICKEGWTALMYACQGCKNTIQFLIEKGADFSLRAKDGDNALILAITYGHTEIVEQLLNRGADIYIHGKDGLSARQKAMMRFPCQYILKMFVDKKSVMSTNAVNVSEALAKQMRTDTMPTEHDTMQTGHDTLPTGHDTMPTGHGTMPTGHGTMPKGHDALLTRDDTMPTGHDTLPTGHDTLPTGHDTMPTGHGTMPKGHDALLTGDDTMPTGHNTMPTGHDTISARNDTMPTRHDTFPASNDTIQTVHDTMPARNDTMPSGHVTIPTGHYKMPTGHATNIFQDKKNIKPSGYSNKVLNIQQHTKLDGSETNNLRQKKRENFETKCPVTQEKDEMLLCETHHNPSMQFKKRKRTKRTRSHTLHKEFPSPKGSSSSGSKVKCSKDVNSHGSNVIFNIARENGELKTRTLQTQEVQHLGPGKDSDDKLSSDNTDKSVSACSTTTETKSPDTINKSVTDNIHIQLDTAAWVEEESTYNVEPRKYFTNDNNATGVQNDDESPECTFRYKDKFLLQLADLLSDHKQETVNTKRLQDAKNIQIVFKYYIGHVDHVHLQNPMYVYITDVENCVIGDKT